MISYFPKAFPDEILYSVIARYAWSSINQSPKNLSRQLFAYASTKATIDLPSHLNDLFENVPFHSVSSVDDIIKNYTLYPFYKPFLVEKKRAAVLESMKGNYGASIHTRVGINASKIIRLRYPKFCPTCFLEDLKNYGQSYWHRVHQIPDILVCPDHNVYIEEYVPNLAEINRSHYIPAPLEFNTLWKVRENSSELLLKLSREYSQMLIGEPGFDINFVNYVEQLGRTCFMTGRRLYRENLLSSFKGFIQKEKFDILFQNLVSPDKWLCEIIRRPTHIFHPLRHLLVSEFLKQVEKNSKPVNKTFGAGPWKCINKTAIHYGEPVIENIEIYVDRKSKREIAAFVCGCGMIYTKSWVTKNGILEEFVRVKTWGPVWQEKLEACLAEKKSLRETARILGTDAKTVAIYSREENKKQTKNLSTPFLLKQKNQWLRLLDLFENSKVIKARRHNPRLYMWLYRNDKQWLEKINFKNRTFAVTEKKSRCDWKKIDQDLLNQLSFAFERLTSTDFQGRITKSLISRIINKEKYLTSVGLKNVPKSKSYLESIIESHEQFQIRRVRAATIAIVNSGERLTIWKIIRLACLRKPLKPLVQKEIRQVLER